MEFSARVRRGIEEETPKFVVEEYEPSWGWTKDSDANYLIVDLPGFRKEEVKLELYNSGKLVVSGERRVQENKHVKFEKTFQIPESSNTEKVTGKFDEGILYVTVPKLIVEEKKVPENHQHHDPDENVHSYDDDQKNKDEAEISSKDEDGKGKLSSSSTEGDEQVGSSGITGLFPMEQTKKKWDQNESNLTSTILDVLNKNKGMVITAVLAFSFGLLVSQKFDSTKS